MKGYVDWLLHVLEEAYGIVVSTDGSECANVALEILRPINEGHCLPPGSLAGLRLQCYWWTFPRFVHLTFRTSRRRSQGCLYIDVIIMPCAKASSQQYNTGSVS